MAAWTASELITRGTGPWKQDEATLSAIERTLIELDAVPDPRRHPWLLEIWTRTRLYNVTFAVQGHAAIDHLVDLLFAHAENYANPAMYVLPAAKPGPPDAYGNQLTFDLDPEAGIGAVACNMTRGRTPGTWWSFGDLTDPGRPFVWDDHNAAECVFPANAPVPFAGIRGAVHEFYEHGGEVLPRAVDWQQSPEVRWLGPDRRGESVQPKVTDETASSTLAQYTSFREAPYRHQIPIRSPYATLSSAVSGVPNASTNSRYDRRYPKCARCPRSAPYTANPATRPPATR